MRVAQYFTFKAISQSHNIHSGNPAIIMPALNRGVYL